LTDQTYQSANTLETAPSVQPYGVFILFDDFEKHFMLFAVTGFLNQFLQKPLTCPESAFVFDDTHCGKPTAPAPARDQCHARRFAIHQQHTTGKQIDAVFAEHGQELNEIEIDGNEVILKAEIQQLSEFRQRVV